MRSIPIPLLSILLSFVAAACFTSTPEALPESDDAMLVSNEELRNPIDTTLADTLLALEQQCHCRLGMAAIHVESGWRTAWNADEPFPMASVAKLPMALTLLRKVDSGSITLDSVVELTRNDHQPGGSRLFYRVRKDDGMVSVHDLLEAMITESDNTAADKILRIAGGPAAANSLMKTLRLPNIDITSYEGELILKWAGINPAEDDSGWTRERMYRKIQDVGHESWDSAGARLINDPHDAAAPDAFAKLLVKLQKGEILSRTTTDTLLAIMHRTVTGRGRLPGRLPEGTPIAHKTGTIGSVANDVGIITLPGAHGHLAIAVFIKDAQVPKQKRDATIATVSALVYAKALQQ